MCLQADTIAGLAKQRFADLNVTLLEACVKLRRRVYLKVAGHDIKSQAVRRALYR